jgi:hypothetical protein
MDYYFHFFITKISNFLLHNLFFPVSIFVLLSPLAFIVIYTVENKISLSIQDLQKTEENVDSSVLGISSSRIDISKDQAVSLQVTNSDYRAIVLDSYFSRYNSPLTGYGQVFVDNCNKYNAPYDCTTLPAIAFVETKLCTLAASEREKNCWGFGGSPPNRMIFKSYNDAIDLITKRLVNGYGPSYMTDPVSMQYVYCGPNCHSWGRGVQQQRDVINQMSIGMGYGKLF